MINNAEKLDQCTKDVHTIARALEAEFNTITINSGYRSPEYNESVGGVKDSAHVTGEAADISVSNVHAIKLGAWVLNNLSKYHVCGLGIDVYKNYIHVDFKQRAVTPAVWVYGKNGAVA